MQILPQTTALSAGHVDFLMLDGGEHGEHGDHVHPHPISQTKHGFGKKLPQRTSINILGYFHWFLVWRQRKFFVDKGVA